jgi:anaerobic magnesium-protoporphyrin IX monomethyl ester cyclase
MRAVFAFPPPASPSYTPLGLASLAAHVKTSVPNCSLTLLDLNLETWDWLAIRDPQLRDLRSFLQGGAPGRAASGPAAEFMDDDAYAARRPHWNAAWERMGTLGEQARRFVEAGEAGDTGVARGSGDAATDFAAWLDDGVERLLRSDPQLIGFSVMYLDQLAFALALARRVKNRVGAQRTRAHAVGASRPPANGQSGSPTIVLGGAAMSAVAVDEIRAACPYIDGIVAGEGEHAVAALCSAGDAAATLRLSGSIERPEARRTSDEQGPAPLRAPDFTAFDLTRYWNPSPVLPVLFSRGCAWRRCRFCAHNFSFGRYRHKDVDAFVAELAELQARHGARHFYFADQFIAGNDLAHIADALLAAKLDLRFHVMGRPDPQHPRAQLDKLHHAGCRWISWGVETGSQRLLDIVDKGTRVPVVERVIRDAAAAGIANMLMMIFGLPTGTDADLEQTFAFIDRVQDRIDIMTASQFVLFAGTPFADSAAQYGLQILGARELLRVGGQPVHSTRLDFREIGADGSLRPPRGALEVAAWEKRKAWLKDFTSAERFCCEHSLLRFSR